MANIDFVVFVCSISISCFFDTENLRDCSVSTFMLPKHKER